MRAFKRVKRMLLWCCSGMEGSTDKIQENIVVAKVGDGDGGM